VLVCAVFLPFSFPSYSFAQSASTEALHTVGHKIFDADNNEVYLRGLGHAGGADSITGNWGGEGEAVFSYGYKWRTLADLPTRMDQTFQCMRDVWHVNTIREFDTVNWWWEDTVNPYQAYGEGPNQIMSNRDYWDLLLQRAQAAGIYVIFTPFTFFDYYTTESSGSGGIPTALTSQGAAYMATINSTGEMQAWSTWWTSVADRLKQYPNVIFDLWNEPDSPANKTAYFNYMIEAYEAIRATGCQNIILMQWRQGVVPNWQEEMTWIPDFQNQITAELGHAPTNIVYSVHAYRYVWNHNWETSYGSLLAQLQSQNMIGCTRSGGVDVPVAIPEMGIGLDLTGTALNNELEWWASILRACKTLDISVVGYYWTQHVGWTPDQAFVEGTWATGQQSPTPTIAGQLFIDTALETTVTLSVSLQSPENKTYTVNDVPLSCTTNMPTRDISYSLDGASNITISGNTTLIDLSEGTHSIIVYAEDYFGNTSSSTKVYFTVDTIPPIPIDTTPPNLKLLSPENKTYATSLVPLTFTVNESTSQITYSIDGQTNVAITGNSTLSGLTDSSHSIVVYANDLNGNTGSSNPIQFTVDTTPPRIAILSPQNITYEASDVPLNFTVNEPVLQIAYNLDEHGIVNISGNTSLAALPAGLHQIVVYANDTVGNFGSSETVDFSIAQKTEPQAFPTWGIIAIVAAVVGLSFLLYFTKLKKTKINIT
jgi:hypothetical protein